MPSKYIPKNNTNMDQFWRKKFMQVLEAMSTYELTWATDHWEEFGINEKEKEIIMKEYEKQLKYRAIKKYAKYKDYFENK
jgi:hypothetical protein